MRGVAEAINAEPACVSCFTIGTITDQSRAKQRRNFDIIVMLGQMKTESCISDGEFGVTAVDGVAGKTRAIAEVFPIGSAISAFAIGPTKPWNANAMADMEFRICSLTDLFHAANNLMARNQRQLRVRQFAIDYVKVSAANSAGTHAHEQLPSSRLWLWHIAQL